MDIEEFKSVVNAGTGLLKTNRFKLVIPGAANMLDQAEVNRTLEFRCEAATYPGFMLTNSDVRRWGYGPVEKRPFGPNFTQLQCLFQNDTESTVWTFFHNWMSKILNHDVRSGIRSTANGATPYTLSYKEEYSTDIHLFVYDEAGKEKLHLVCREAFPSQIVDLPLSWGDNNNLFKFQVGFEFVDWYLDDGTPGPLGVSVLNGTQTFT